MLKRPAAIDSLLAQLLEHLQQHPAAATRPAPPAASVPAGRQRSHWSVGICAGVAVALLGGVLWWRSMRGVSPR